tara:strand:+ start:2555 stop:2950 length:396 start_codon:yes stop_codon:yes gene_type:complete
MAEVFDGHNVIITSQDGTASAAAIPGVLSVKLPDVTYASIQTTSSDTDTHTQRQGLAQWGTCDVELLHQAAHSGIDAAGTKTYVVTVNDMDGTAVTTMTFDGYVANYVINGNETDANVTSSLSIQLKDEPS